MRDVMIPSSKQLSQSMSSSNGVELNPHSLNLGTCTDQQLFLCDIRKDDFDNSFTFLQSIETEAKVRRAIKLLKEEKKKVEKEMRNNLELAREKMTQHDACSSPHANRIVAAIAMGRVANTEQKVECFNIALKRLKKLKVKVEKNALSFDAIYDEIVKALNAGKNVLTAKLPLHTDDELLRSLNRKLLKQALQKL